MYIYLYVKCPLLLLGFNKTLLFSTDLKEVLNIKIYKNTSSGSRVVPCGLADRRTDMTKSRLAILRTLLTT